MNKTVRTKLITWAFVVIALIHSVTANGIINIEEAKAAFGAMGNIGYYFSSIVNNMQYFGWVLAYWMLIILYFLLIYFIMIWLPLKIYPKFVQYQNLFRVLLGVEIPSERGGT